MDKKVQDWDRNRKVDTKGGSKEHSHHQIHGLSRGRPLIIDRIWIILLA